MLQNYNFYKVLSVFLENPTKMYKWRELSEKLNLGPPSTKKYLEELEKEEIIVRKEVMGRTAYAANRESRKYRIFQMFDIVMKIENAGIINYLDNFYGFPTIILIGSYARGEAVEDSDIDIAIVTESEKYAGLGEFEKQLKKPIHLFVFSKAGLEKLRKANPSLYNGIINGYMLTGHLDVT